jgi:hypothetical protein
MRWLKSLWERRRTMNAPYEVRIVLGPRFCEIDPGELFVNNGDAVTFINGTEGLVRLFFGGPEPFEVDLVDLKPGEQSRPLTVRSSQKPPKSFQYAVYSAARRAFGVGGSNPRIIIMQ